MVTGDPHLELGNREQAGVLATAEFCAGAHVLVRMGLSLNTAVCFPQLSELAAFAKAVPERLQTVSQVEQARQPHLQGSSTCTSSEKNQVISKRTNDW